MTATNSASKSLINLAGDPAGKPTGTSNRKGTTEVFGPYEVYERLGIGGMATVHRAKESGIEGFERIVALKRLLSHLAEDTSFVNAFVREARLASQLQHANIVQLYELGRVGQVLFISMEYIEGRDIRAILRQSRKVTGPPPMSVFLSLMSQLCDALDYAHNRCDQNGEALGIVHRDVSPSNLLVTRSGHLKVIDFGIAKAQTAQLRTETGRVKGKLAYMAPEALKAQELDARSDLFSVGVVAHELLTARPLFAARNEYETLTRLQKMTIEPPSKHNRKCPPELDEIVLKALERDRDKRWRSAADMRDALHALRARYQIASTNREVSSWLDWAFALKAPQTGSFAAVSSSSLSRHRIGMGTGTGSNAGVSPARAFARASSSITPSGGITPTRNEDSNVAPLPPPPGGLMALEAAASTAPAAAEVVDEVSEAAVDYAWGNEGEQAAVPSALDEVPDVSLKMSRMSPSAADELVSETPLFPASPAGTSPGIRMVTDSAVTNVTGIDPDTTTPYASVPEIEIISENEPEIEVEIDAGPGADDDDLALNAVALGALAAENRKRRAVLLFGGLGVLAAAAVVLFLITGKSTPVVDQAPPAVSAPAVPSTAAIRFMVEPQGALVRVAGHEDHSGAPYNLEVSAPGTHRVEILHPGYKSYVTELEVGAGENHVVRVALEAAKNEKSQITIRLRRKRVAVHLDGNPLPAGNPVVTEVDPGTHVLTIVDDDGDELWRQEIETAARTNYELEPSIKRKRKRSDDRDKAHPIDDLAMGEVDESSEPEISDFETAERSAAATDATPLAVVAELPTTELPTTKIPTGPVEKPVARRATSKGPVTLLPHQVKKRAGSLPAISDEERDIPKRASAKLCIDTRGNVVSAKLLTSMSNRAKTRFTEALRGWRYAPHIKDGRAVPACFAVNFSIERSGR